MKIKKTNEIPSSNVTMYGSTGTTIKWIWSKDDNVPNFFLRKFTITPGSQIGLHSHPEEHEMFILAGKGDVFNNSGEIFNVEAEDSLYVPPDELHGYRNTGSTNLVFLCVIPRLSKD